MKQQWLYYEKSDTKRPLGSENRKELIKRIKTPNKMRVKQIINTKKKGNIAYNSLDIKKSGVKKITIQTYYYLKKRHKFKPHGNNRKKL